MCTVGSLYNSDFNKQTIKPFAILYYNNTKGGMDVFDKLCVTYTTTRKTIHGL